jgi:hypothetical protein
MWRQEREVKFCYREELWIVRVGSDWMAQKFPGSNLMSSGVEK